MADNIDSIFSQEVQEEQEEVQEEVQEEAEAKPAEEPIKVEGQKMVPLPALQQERALKKQLKEEVRALQEKQGKMEDRFQQFLERMVAPKEPDYEEDPVEAIRYQNKKLQDQLNELSQRNSQQDQLTAAQKADKDLQDRYISAANEFSQSNPDFMEAYSFYVTNRINALVAGGFPLHEAQRMAVQEEKSIVQMSFEDDTNPAERIYKIAKASGFKANDKKLEKLETIEKGMSASKTLGGTEQAPLSLEALADMSDEDLDKNWDKMFGKQRMF